MGSVIYLIKTDPNGSVTPLFIIAFRERTIIGEIREKIYLQVTPPMLIE